MNAEKDISRMYQNDPHEHLKALQLHISSQ